MELYHGSNVEVKEPKILSIQKTADFGMGFYTTSSLQQAKDWARIKTGRRGFGNPCVSSFEFDDEQAKKKLEIKYFHEADDDWLEFVVANRKGTYAGKKFDLVVGPVADDQTITVIDNYIRGLLSSKVALAELEPQNLTDQYAFLTNASLNHLKTIGVENG